MTEYDRVLYPSYTHPQTHPDRLAVIGRLFGLEPAPVTQCRVLELGCGDGTNLAPMAWAFPESEFVGLDLAGQPVQQGQEMVRELGLGNLRLVQGNVLEIDGGWRRFDYIIAHGLYSWVPPEVREHVLASCRKLLGPHGIAFISYNAFPGCHLRNMLREELLFHVRDFKGEERVEQAVALTRFLAQAQDTRDEYRLWMKAELARILEHAPGHLYHDELSEFNQPFYFTQFMEQAARHGLQYLGEADFFEMSDHIFLEPVQATLSKLAKNRWLREQYLDFLKCRRFRQTLLCPGEAGLRPEAESAKIARMLISSGGAPIGEQPVDLRAGVTCVFETPKGAKCQTDLPAGKAALMVLAEAWPTPLTFEELVEQAARRLDKAGLHGESARVEREGLCDFLLQLYAGGVVEFRTVMPPMARVVSERPVASPVARWQVGRGTFVSSLFHVAVQIEDEVGRSLLSWLDGTRDRKALLEQLWALIESKKALNVPDGKEARARRELEVKLEENLEKLARLGLLVG